MIVMKANRNVYIGVRRIQDIDQKTKRAIRNGLFELGKSLTKTSKQGILKQPKTGTKYRRGRGKNRYTASSAGEYPANRTGNLRSSIDFKVQGSTNLIFGAKDTGKIGMMNYGKFLEKGTKFMSARPFLKPSVSENVVQGRETIKNKIQGALTT